VELACIVKCLNMKADVAYVKVVTCTNVMAIKDIGRCVLNQM
jgi:hypothetical protein